MIMMKNNVVKWLSVLALFSYAAGVFVIADRSLWLGMVLIGAGACLSLLAAKEAKKTKGLR